VAQLEHIEESLNTTLRESWRELERESLTVLIRQGGKVRYSLSFHDTAIN
jgi:hypothetical protein